MGAMSKHTAGPWKNSGAIGAGIWITAPESQIAVVYGKGTTPEAVANADLVAAAPELLEALKKIAGLRDTWVYAADAANEAIAIARDAVKKAEGRS